MTTVRSIEEIRNEIWQRLRNTFHNDLCITGDYTGHVAGIAISFTLYKWGEYGVEFCETGATRHKRFKTRTKKNGSFDFSAAVGSLIRYVAERRDYEAQQAEHGLARNLTLDLINERGISLVGRQTFDPVDLTVLDHSTVVKFVLPHTPEGRAKLARLLDFVQREAA
jgi:hypothetical protein